MRSLISIVLGSLVCVAVFSAPRTGPATPASPNSDFVHLVRAKSLTVNYDKAMSGFFEANGTPFVSMLVEVVYDEPGKGTGTKSYVNSVVLDCIGESILVVVSASYDKDRNLLGITEGPVTIPDLKRADTPVTAIMSTICPPIVKRYNSQKK